MLLGTLGASFHSFHENMLLVILTEKKLLERFTKKNWKKPIKKSL